MFLQEICAKEASDHKFVEVNVSTGVAKIPIDKIEWK